MLVSGNWMLHEMTSFTHNLFERIPSQGPGHSPWALFSFKIKINFICRSGLTSPAEASRRHRSAVAGLPARSVAARSKPARTAPHQALSASLCSAYLDKSPRAAGRGGARGMRRTARRAAAGGGR
ncbi:flagellar biosynthetic protein FliQ, partial [Catenuloplanes japonicus]|uniref:flagellar biosynthetic protein FliQ n=1 Tax=Catenuloplanes japonicus TaxID=33876 RepID=UPI0038B7EEBD